MRVNASILGLALLVGCSSSSDGTSEPAERPHATAGLSVVTEFPDTPEDDTLWPNPALIDGDTFVSASLDIGYAPSLSGDLRFREAGIQLSDATARVNLLRVWTDRLLPQGVFGAYDWYAYSSDDNLRWTQVPVIIAMLDASSSFADIHIGSANARYLKVVVRPLQARITSDARYANVFVTELQAFFATP